MLSNAQVVHLHPTNLCNLKCSHCYSVSGPEKDAHIDVKRLLRITKKLASFGYEYVSISGGEPTIYRDIGELCHGLREQSFSVSMISNGFRPSIISDLIEKDLIDFVGISFDGLPKIHDAVRNRSGAFEKAVTALKGISSQFSGVGAVVSVTNSTLPMLPELAEKLVPLSPKKMHFRPLASVGRAARRANGLETLPEEALFRLVLLTKLFGEMWPNVGFECDVVIPPQLDGWQLGSSRLVSPLVVREDGSVSPFVYDRMIQADLCTVEEDSFSPFLTEELAGHVSSAVEICRQKVASDFYSEISALIRISNDK